MKQIITIQHTQSIHHTNGMVGSWTDWDLSERGIAQARMIGKNLKAFLGETDAALYSSDLLRARHTAEIIGEALGLKPKLTSALRERNLGKCVGKSVAWLRENMECAERTVDDRMFLDAESRRDEWMRLKPFFEELLTSDEETAIVVSHGDLLGVFYTMWLGLEPEALNTCDFSGMAGSVGILQTTESGKRIVRRFGDLSFLN